MIKKILFPFSTESQYYEGYSWAAELASKMKTDLLLFTTSKENDEQSLERIYHSLLEAQGHYLQSARDKHLRPSKTEQLIEKGADLKKSLLDFLQKNTAYITVIDSSSQIEQPALNEVIRYSQGAIVLPVGIKTVSRDNSFYEKLRQAELYKLPAHFFDSLGRDHSLFNYLGRFFRKRS